MVLCVMLGFWPVDAYGLRGRPCLLLVYAGRPEGHREQARHDERPECGKHEPAFPVDHSLVFSSYISVDEDGAVAHGLQLSGGDGLDDHGHPPGPRLADDDGTVLVDLLDDGHMPVDGAAAVHAGAEADRVAGTRPSPDIHTEASRLVGPETAVAHVGVDRLADLPAADEGPPGALESLISGRRLVGAGGIDVDVVAVRIHHQRQAEPADVRALVDVAGLSAAGHAVHVLKVLLGGLRDARVFHEVALTGVVGDDQRILIRQLGEGRARVRGLEGLDTVHAVLQVDAAVVGVGRGVGDALGRCLVRALRVDASPYAAVHLQQAPCAAVAVVGVRVGVVKQRGQARRRPSGALAGVCRHEDRRSVGPAGLRPPPRGLPCEDQVDLGRRRPWTLDPRQAEEREDPQRGRAPLPDSGTQTVGARACPG
jgi:hypothetical protein